jgi:GntR family transcriptional regulator
MLHLTINQSDGVPLYQQLIRQLKQLIATGRLRPHDELPPVRVLAQQLLLNPNTVVRAYRELELAGLLYKRRGAGTYVAEAGTRFTEAECRRMLTERADALLVEARNLGFSVDEVVKLLKQRNADLKPEAATGGGDKDGSN